MEMSITRGINLVKFDEKEKNGRKEIGYASWKNWFVDMWISDFLFGRHLGHRKEITNIQTTDYSKDSYLTEAIIPKHLIQEMAETLINRNFYIVSPWINEEIEDDENLQEYLYSYGLEFKEMLEKFQDGYAFIYYDGGC